MTEKSKYQQILTTAWENHLKPKEPNAPKFISIFAGCGGSSLGYSMAGCKELLAIEWDKNAVGTFKMNFPEVNVFQGDVGKLTNKKIEEITGITESGQLDILDGSPPCQGFSMAGKRELSDNRNQLFKEYVRILNHFKPKTFVMENVAGMVRGKMRLLFKEILAELKETGYEVSARLMNAMYFNVPQARQRLIFIGVRKDLGIKPSHPKPQFRPITVLSALKNIDAKTTATWNAANKIANSNRIKYIKLCKPGEVASKYHPKNHCFNLMRAPMNKPCQTITKTAGLCHYKENRFLVVEELKRLGSFPDEYTFPNDLNNCYQRIGNSVPPLLMKAIAEHIKNNILGKL